MMKYLLFVSLMLVAATHTYAGSCLAGKDTIIVTLNHNDWVYKTNEKATFTIRVMSDGKAVKNVRLYYEVGREKMTPDKTDSVTLEDGLLKVEGGTLKDPGFLRCYVRGRVNGQLLTGMATAAFSPLEIKPTTTMPDDFEAFWDSAKANAAKIPMDVKATLMPERSDDKVNTFLVSIQSYEFKNRLYGILCVPKKEGKYPAILEVPGAGVRSYYGNKTMTVKGIITFQIGIHGIPVAMSGPVYDDLRFGALRDYQTYNLDDRDRYYYKRVYMGCIRAIDYIFSLPSFDGQNLAVSGGSQGGALAIVTAALDRRVKCLASFYPALSDLTGYLYNRA
ncbi:acetylxylan esterase, partial [Chitinophaga sp.]|uniref:acetylxylan esterase n=1 Tax=Chitinophaga sp. TaxID=1869181 RepID=UPI002C042ED7